MNLWGHTCGFPARAPWVPPLTRVLLSCTRLPRKPGHADQPTASLHAIRITQGALWKREVRGGAAGEELPHGGGGTYRVPPAVRRGPQLRQQPRPAGGRRRTTYVMAAQRTPVPARASVGAAHQADGSTTGEFRGRSRPPSPSPHSAKSHLALASLPLASPSHKWWSPCLFLHRRGEKRRILGLPFGSRKRKVRAAR